MADEKDRPLLMRREVTEYEYTYEDHPEGRVDVQTGQVIQVMTAAKPVASALFLGSGSEDPSWPPRHEFGWDWLAKTPEATYDPIGRTITLALANAQAKYQLVDSVEVDGETRTSAQGVWGVYAEGSVA